MTQGTSCCFFKFPLSFFITDFCFNAKRAIFAFFEFPKIHQLQKITKKNYSRYKKSINTFPYFTFELFPYQFLTEFVEWCGHEMGPKTAPNNTEKMTDFSVFIFSWSQKKFLDFFFIFFIFCLHTHILG